MATGAIRRHRGAILRRQPVIAFKKRFDPVAGQVVFGVQPFGRMTATADILGNRHGGTTLEGSDFVFVVTASAGGRIM